MHQTPQIQPNLSEVYEHKCMWTLFCSLLKYLQDVVVSWCATAAGKSQEDLLQMSGQNDDVALFMLSSALYSLLLTSALFTAHCKN